MPSYRKGSEEILQQNSHKRKAFRDTYQEQDRESKRLAHRGLTQKDPNMVFEMNYSANDVHQMGARCSACGERETSNLQCVDCLKTKGNNELSAEQYDSAVDSYTRAIELNPTNYYLYSNRSAAYLLLHQYELAVRDADTAIELKPDWEKGYSRKGSALLGQNRPEEAFAAFAEAMRLDPDNTIVKENLVEISLKNLIEPKIYEVKGKRNSPIECRMCCNVYCEPLTLQCGHSYCKQCLVKTNNPQCIQCGQKFSKQNLPHTNISLNTFLRQNFPWEYEILKCKEEGNTAFGSAKYEEAILHYSKAIESAPQNHVLHSNRSVAYLKLNRLDEANQDADTCIHLRPLWAKSFVRKAAVLGAMKKPSEALGVIVEGLRRDFANEELKSLLGDSIVRSIQALGEKKVPLEISSIFASNIMNVDNNEIMETKSAVAVSDISETMNCSLCFELLYDPLTPVCGHTFCRICLSRALDHNEACPMCRKKLPHSLNRQSADVVITEILQEYFTEQYTEREEATKKELEEMSTNIPIFVCSLLFPYNPLPLHIFEPRYRLMLRRCIESGTRRFGMVTHTNHGFAEYGTIAEIGNVQMLPDGRSLIETVGSQRFKIKEHSVKDGYLVAKIEMVNDEPIPENEEENVQTLGQEVRNNVLQWLGGLSYGNRYALFNAYGQPPEDPVKFSFWLASITPVGEESKYTFLKMTSVKERLERLKLIWMGPQQQ